MTRTARQGLGDAGERAARRALETLGYEFVAAKWRCSYGELDLVLLHNAELVFVEVKTRRGEQFGAAEEAISGAQQRRLLLSAQSYLAEHIEFSDHFWRIDLIALTLDSSGAISRMTHVENAVTLP